MPPTSQWGGRHEPSGYKSATGPQDPTWRVKSKVHPCRGLTLGWDDYPILEECNSSFCRGTKPGFFTFCTPPTRNLHYSMDSSRLPSTQWSPPPLAPPRGGAKIDQNSMKFPLGSSRAPGPPWESLGPRPVDFGGLLGSPGRALGKPGGPKNPVSAKKPSARVCFFLFFQGLVFSLICDRIRVDFRAARPSR